MFIKNKDRLTTTTFRKHALDIVEAGINNVLPGILMRSSISYNRSTKSLTVQSNKYDTSDGRIFIIGGGKAANLMAESLEDIIGIDNIFAGIVNCKSSSIKTGKIKIIKAGHPLPDKKGLDGVRQMLAIKSRYSVNDNDFIICLISGGGSALLPCPVDGISLRDNQKATELLIKSGADIYEINTVRKHLSAIKGGRLGLFYSPTRVITLIISDVIGDELSVIASGPTVADLSTFQEAFEVLQKHNLMAKMPEPVINYLTMGYYGFIEETPEYLANCDNYIIGNNQHALEAMAARARELGFNPLVLTAGQKGDTSEVAYQTAREITAGKYDKCDAIIIGGETTPRIPENAGKGGRNQYYAATSLLAMQSYPRQWALASTSTDGSDYLPDIAGAIVDNNSLDQAAAKGIDVRKYIDNFDSYNLLKKLGNSLIVTGSTGTNVMDIMLYLLDI